MKDLNVLKNIKVIQQLELTKLENLSKNLVNKNFV